MIALDTQYDPFAMLTFQVEQKARRDGWDLAAQERIQDKLTRAHGGDPKLANLLYLVTDILWFDLPFEAQA